MNRLDAMQLFVRVAELGIYAVLASNRYVPHRIRVLIEFLASRLAAAQTTAQ